MWAPAHSFQDPCTTKLTPDPHQSHLHWVSEHWKLLCLVPAGHYLCGPSRSPHPATPRNCVTPAGRYRTQHLPLSAAPSSSLLTSVVPCCLQSPLPGSSRHHHLCFKHPLFHLHPIIHSSPTSLLFHVLLFAAPRFPLTSHPALYQPNHPVGLQWINESGMGPVHYHLELGLEPGLRAINLAKTIMRIFLAFPLFFFIIQSSAVPGMLTCNHRWSQEKLIELLNSAGRNSLSKSPKAMKMRCLCWTDPICEK